MKDRAVFPRSVLSCNCDCTSSTRFLLFLFLRHPRTLRLLMMTWIHGLLVREFYIIQPKTLYTQLAFP